MELPETTVLRLQRTVGRLYATIDDPRTRNAMTAELVADLGKLVVAVEADRTIRAVVLQGANGAFCAGSRVDNCASAVRLTA